MTEDRRSCSSCGPSCKARICLTLPVHGRSGRCPIGAFGAAAAAAAAAAGRVSATGWSAAAAAARARRVAPSMPAGTETSAGTGDDCCSGDSGAGSAGAPVFEALSPPAGCNFLCLILQPRPPNTLNSYQYPQLLQPGVLSSTSTHTCTHDLRGDPAALLTT